MDPVLISVAAFVAVAALVTAVWFVMRDLGPTKTEDRLQVLAGLKAPEHESAGVLKEEVLKEGFDGLTGMINNLMKRFGNLNSLLQQADSPVTPDVFFGMTLGLSLVGVAGAFIARSPIPLLPVAGLFTGSLPFIWMLLRRRRRFKKFAAQLPDALELVARALRSGHGHLRV